MCTSAYSLEQRLAVSSVSWWRVWLPHMKRVSLSPIPPFACNSWMEQSLMAVDVIRFVPPSRPDTSKQAGVLLETTQTIRTLPDLRGCGVSCGFLCCRGHNHESSRWHTRKLAFIEPRGRGWQRNYSRQCVALCTIQHDNPLQMISDGKSWRGAQPDDR